MNAREWVQNGTTSHGAGWWKSLAGAESYGWRSLDTPPAAPRLQALGKTGWWNLREYRDGGERMGAVRNDHRPEQVGGSRQDAQGYLSH
jgi:hypothetical protein